MLSQPEPACLVIADITGYTGYLAGVELDHAQDILADLMGTVVGALRPTFRLAKLEGDAAFVYAITETVDGGPAPGHHRALLLRLPPPAPRHPPGVELRVQRLHPRPEPRPEVRRPPRRRSIRQRIASREELVGSDVIVVHRLLKNHVREDTGHRRLRAVHRGLRRGDGPRRPGRGGPRRASRGLRGRRRGRGLGARPRGRLGRGARPGPATSSSRRTRHGSTRRSSTPRRRSSGSI